MQETRYSCLLAVLFTCFLIIFPSLLQLLGCLVIRQDYQQIYDLNRTITVGNENFFISLTSFGFLPRNSFAFFRRIFLEIASLNILMCFRIQIERNISLFWLDCTFLCFSLVIQYFFFPTFPSSFVILVILWLLCGYLGYCGCFWWIRYSSYFVYSALLLLFRAFF